MKTIFIYRFYIDDGLAGDGYRIQDEPIRTVGDLKATIERTRDGIAAESGYPPKNIVIAPQAWHELLDD